MRRSMTTLAMAAVVVTAFSTLALAAETGFGEDPAVHPGHIGYIQSGKKGGGVPAAEFHTVDGAPTYEPGIGGWADAKRADTAAGGSDGVQTGFGEDPTIHPGHIGYIRSGQKGGGVPAAHFHTVDGAPTYAPGIGGWADAVRAAAKAGPGVPHAHPE